MPCDVNSRKGDSYAQVPVLLLNQVLDCGLDPGVVRWLLPLPPATSLVILVGFLSHTVWFVRNRLRRAAQRLSLARAEKAEEDEYRRQRRRRPVHDGSVPSVPGEVTWH